VEQHAFDLPHRLHDDLLGGFDVGVVADFHLRFDPVLGVGVGMVMGVSPHASPAPMTAWGGSVAMVIFLACQ
jgi:hypothetical protein